MQKIFVGLIIFLLAESAFAIEMDTQNESLFKGNGRRLAYTQSLVSNC